MRLPSHRQIRQLECVVANHPSGFFDLAAAPRQPLDATTLPTSPRKTRVRGFRRHASGQTSSRRRCRSIITPGLRGCGYKTVSGRHEFLNQDPIQENGGINLYGFVRNNPINLFDPLGLVDCGALAGIIGRMDNLIDNAIRSMSDINQMFNSAQRMQSTALAGEFAYAVMGGASAAGELSEFNATRFSRPVYNLGGVTSAIAFNEAVYAGLVDVPNSAIADSTGLNILNPAEMAAEQEEEMANNMSESTYQTIRGLQGQLANMMDMYRQNCPCKK